MGDKSSEESLPKKKKLFERVITAIIGAEIVYISPSGTPPFNFLFFLIGLGLIFYALSS